MASTGIPAEAASTSEDPLQQQRSWRSLRLVAAGTCLLMGAAFMAAAVATSLNLHSELLGMAAASPTRILLEAPEHLDNARVTVDLTVHTGSGVVEPQNIECKVLVPCHAGKCAALEFQSVAITRNGNGAAQVVFDIPPTVDLEVLKLLTSKKGTSTELACNYDVKIWPFSKNGPSIELKRSGKWPVASVLGLRDIESKVEQPMFQVSHEVTDSSWSRPADAHLGTHCSADGNFKLRFPAGSVAEGIYDLLQRTAIVVDANLAYKDTSAAAVRAAASVRGPASAKKNEKDGTVTIYLPFTARGEAQLVPLAGVLINSWKGHVREETREHLLERSVDHFITISSTRPRSVLSQLLGPQHRSGIKISEVHDVRDGDLHGRQLRSVVRMLSGRDKIDRGILDTPVSSFNTSVRIYNNDNNLVDVDFVVTGGPKTHVKVGFAMKNHHTYDPEHGQQNMRETSLENSYVLTNFSMAVDLDEEQLDGQVRLVVDTDKFHGVESYSPGYNMKKAENSTSIASVSASFLLNMKTKRISLNAQLSSTNSRNHSAFCKGEYCYGMGNSTDISDTEMDGKITVDADLDGDGTTGGFAKVVLDLEDMGMPRTLIDFKTHGSGANELNTLYASMEPSTKNPDCVDLTQDLSQAMNTAVGGSGNYRRLQNDKRRASDKSSGHTSILCGASSAPHVAFLSGFEFGATMKATGKEHHYDVTAWTQPSCTMHKPTADFVMAQDYSNSNYGHLARQNATMFRQVVNQTVDGYSRNSSSCIDRCSYEYLDGRYQSVCTRGACCPSNPWNMIHSMGIDARSITERGFENETHNTSFDLSSDELKFADMESPVDITIKEVGGKTIVKGVAPGEADITFTFTDLTNMELKGEVQDVSVDLKMTEAAATRKLNLEANARYVPGAKSMIGEENAYDVLPIQAVLGMDYNPVANMERLMVSGHLMTAGEKQGQLDILANYTKDFINIPTDGSIHLVPKGVLKAGCILANATSPVAEIRFLADSDEGLMMSKLHAHGNLSVEGNEVAGIVGKLDGDGSKHAIKISLHTSAADDEEAEKQQNEKQVLNEKPVLLVQSDLTKSGTKWAGDVQVQVQDETPETVHLTLSDGFRSVPALGTGFQRLDIGVGLGKAGAGIQDDKVQVDMYLERGPLFDINGYGLAFDLDTASGLQVDVKTDLGLVVMTSTPLPSSLAQSVTTFDTVVEMADPTKFEVDVYKASVAASAGVDFSEVVVESIKYKVAVEYEFPVAITEPVAKKAIARAANVNENTVQVTITAERRLLSEQPRRLAKSKVQATITTETVAAVAGIKANTEDTQKIAQALKTEADVVAMPVVTKAATASVVASTRVRARPGDAAIRPPNPSVVRVSSDPSVVATVSVTSSVTSSQTETVSQDAADSANRQQNPQTMMAVVIFTTASLAAFMLA